MSGYGFMHIHTWPMAVNDLARQKLQQAAAQGKKRDRLLTAKEIADEAGRVEGASPHVAHPRPPHLFYGISPEETYQSLEERFERHNRELAKKKKAMPRGQRRALGRAIRKDTRALWTAVVSYPVPWHDPDDGSHNFPEGSIERDRLDRWAALNLAFFRDRQEELGLEITCAVVHFDEGHPHLHFLGIAKDQRLNARKCHPGEVAKAAVEPMPNEEKRDHVKRQNAAYKHAMVRFQDAYFEEVSKPVGLLRAGPRRPRLSRVEYSAQKKAAAAAGQMEQLRINAKDDLDALVRSTDSTRSEKEDLRKKADEAEAEAKASREEKDRLEQQIRDLRENIARLAVERDAMQAADEKRKADKDTLGKEVVDLRARIEELNRQAGLKIREVEALERSHGEMSNKLEASRQDVVSIEAKKAVLTGELADLSSSTTSEQTRLQLLNDDIAKKGAKLENLKLEISRKSEEQAAMSEQQDAMLEVVSTARRDLENLQSEERLAKDNLQSIQAAVVAEEDDRAKRWTELKNAEAELGARSKEIEVLHDGVEAWASGRVIVRQGPDGSRSLIYKDIETHKRLSPFTKSIGPTLLKLQKRLDKKVQGVVKAITESLKGWWTGLLRGVSSGRDEQGRPTFDIGMTPEGDVLVETIDDHRFEVASFMNDLGDAEGFVERFRQAETFLTEAEHRQWVALVAQRGGLEKT